MTLLLQTDIDRVVERILSQPRFQTPGEGFWDRLLERVTSWLASSLARAVEALGGPRAAGLVALALLMVITALAVSRVARRRAATIEQRISLDRILDEGVDPAEIERLAERAAAAGDFSRAVRARFVAGLIRLDRLGAIRYTKGTTTAEISERLRSPTFDRLSADFDAIAYGGRRALAADDARATAGWEQVLDEAATVRR